MKCRTVQPIDVFAGCEPYVKTDDRGRKIIPAGTVICRAEYPPADCVSLVRNGLADPVDDECREACKRTPEQIADAQSAMKKLLSGDPDDDDDDDDETEDDEWLAK